MSTEPLPHLETIAGAAERDSFTAARHLSITQQVAAHHRHLGYVVDRQVPVADGVRFIPKDKSQFKMGETPQATTDDEGRFALSTYNSGDGAPAGEYFVAVAEPDQVQSDENDDTRPVGLNKLKKAPKVPPKYQVAQNSGVTATVEPKDNALAPFQLTRTGKWPCAGLIPGPRPPRPQSVGGSCADRSTTSGFHADRTVGGDRDYCNPHRAAVARRPEGARGRCAAPVPEQPETARAGGSELREHDRVHTARPGGHLRRDHRAPTRGERRERVPRAGHVPAPLRRAERAGPAVPVGSELARPGQPGGHRHPAEGVDLPVVAGTGQPAGHHDGLGHGDRGWGRLRGGERVQQSAVHRHLRPAEQPRQPDPRVRAEREQHGGTAVQRGADEGRKAVRDRAHDRAGPDILAITDGTSNTAILNEDVGRPNRYVGNSATGPRYSGSGWADPDNEYWVDGFTFDGLTTGGPCWTNCNNNNEAYSFHSGGNNTLFADGSVRFLRSTLTVAQFTAMVTMSYGEVVTFD